MIIFSPKIWPKNLDQSESFKFLIKKCYRYTDKQRYRVSKQISIRWIEDRGWTPLDCVYLKKPDSDEI